MKTHSRIILDIHKATGFLRSHIEKALKLYRMDLKRELKSKGIVRLPGLGTIQVRRKRSVVGDQGKHAFKIASFRLSAGMK